MAALGAEVHVVGAVARTWRRPAFDLLQRYPIHVESVVRDPDRPRFLKTRIIAHHQQVVRVDREVRTEFTAEMRKQVWAQVEALFPGERGGVCRTMVKGD